MAHNAFRPYHEIYGEEETNNLDKAHHVHEKKTHKKTPATPSAALADDIDDPQPSPTASRIFFFVCFAIKMFYIFCTCVLYVG